MVKMNKHIGLPSRWNLKESPSDSQGQQDRREHLTRSSAHTPPSPAEGPKGKPRTAPTWGGAGDPGPGSRVGLRERSHRALTHQVAPGLSVSPGRRVRHHSPDHMHRDALPPPWTCAPATISQRNAFVVIQWLSVYSLNGFYSYIFTGDHQAAFLFAGYKGYSEIIRYLQALELDQCVQQAISKSLAFLNNIDRGTLRHLF